jgi:aminobenzoyl-glutamate utilization protein B
MQGTPLHSWQNTAFAGSSIGFKGMMVAARTLALATLDLLTKPDLVKAIREEFEKKRAGKQYVSPLPEGAVPH